MLQKAVSTYMEKKKGGEKRSRHRNCTADVAPRIFSYRGKSRENAADMRNKIAAWVKRRKRVSGYATVKRATEEIRIYLKNADTREEAPNAVAGSCKFPQCAKTSRRRIMSFSSAKFHVVRDFPADGKFAASGRSGIDVGNGRSLYPRDEFLIRPDENGGTNFASLLRKFEILI